MAKTKASWLRPRPREWPGPQPRSPRGGPTSERQPDTPLCSAASACSAALPPRAPAHMSRPAIACWSRRSGRREGPAPGPSSWPRGRTSCGARISRNSRVPPRGPGSTCTSCSTSSAATCRAGWSPRPRAPPSPSGSSPTRSPSRASLRARSPSTPIGAARCAPRRSRSCSPTSGSPRVMAGPTPPTTTRIPRPSSRRSSPAPAFPARFGSIEDARALYRRFFTWYNEEHRHSGIGLMTPAIVRAGRGPEVRAARAITLAGADAAHPERFVRRPPTPPELPTAVWINKPVDKEVPPQ